MKNYLMTLFIFVLTHISLGDSIDLSFAGADVTYSSADDTLVIFIENAASGVGAPDVDIRITALNEYKPYTADRGLGTEDGGKNGSVANNDLRIHMKTDTATRFRFELLDGTTGKLYNPSSNYSYNLLTYDIDGISTTKGGADVLTIYSSLTYTVTENSNLDIDIIDNTSITFSDKDAGAIAGQDGLDQSNFTTAQQNISALLTFSQSSWEFEYAIEAINDTGSGRNLLFDAGELNFTEDTIEHNFVVPEPMAISFISLSAVLAIFIQRIFLKRSMV